MLTVHSGKAPPRKIAADAVTAGDLTSSVWLDLLDATEAERQLVEKATGLRVPQRAELAEIETSSRLNFEDDVLRLSTPIVSPPDADGMPVLSPLGFIVGRDHMLTVRFAPIPSFDIFAERFQHSPAGSPSSATAFIGLLEAMVDRLADLLEHVSADLDQLSRRIFHLDQGRRRGPKKRDMALQGILRGVGRAGDLVSDIRDSLIGLQRIVHYICESGIGWLIDGLHKRFTTLRQDIASLNDYESQLSNKVQFLLDATLGFLNIEQNNVIKVLTVFSIVGIPPTLIASMYGMNFKAMPELDWSWGYQYALTLILLSALLPLLWFWRRGWL